MLWYDFDHIDDDGDVVGAGGALVMPFPNREDPLTEAMFADLLRYLTKQRKILAFYSERCKMQEMMGRSVGIVGAALMKKVNLAEGKRRAELTWRLDRENFQIVTVSGAGGDVHRTRAVCLSELPGGRPDPAREPVVTYSTMPFRVVVRKMSRVPHGSSLRVAIVVANDGAVGCFFSAPRGEKMPANLLFEVGVDDRRLPANLIDDVTATRKRGCCVWVRRDSARGDAELSCAGRELDLPTDWHLSQGVCGAASQARAVGQMRSRMGLKKAFDALAENPEFSSHIVEERRWECDPRVLELAAKAGRYFAHVERELGQIMRVQFALAEEKVTVEGVLRGLCDVASMRYSYEELGRPRSPLCGAGG
jgi:hypothetical protein